MDTFSKFTVTLIKVLSELSAAVKIDPLCQVKIKRVTPITPTPPPFNDFEDEINVIGLSNLAGSFSKANFEDV